MLLAKTSIASSLVLVGALTLSSAHLSGQSARRPTHRKRTTASKKPHAQKPRAARTLTRKASRPRRRSTGPFRSRLARLRLTPQRTAEIQRALMQAGYLNQEPTGKWDDATRDAMKRYQADNGFPTTGLPEAKTLMKLGLGPHSLPEEVDPNAQARASRP